MTKLREAGNQALRRRGYAKKIQAAVTRHEQLTNIRRRLFVKDAVYGQSVARAI